MPETFTPSEIQDKVLDLLAQGMSQSQAANVSGLHRKTVHRWNAIAEFREEIEKRKAMLAAGDRIREAREKSRQAKLTISEEITENRDALPSLLEELRDRKHTRRRQWTIISNNLIHKMVGRLKDLPAEAFPPQVAVTVLKLGMDMAIAVEDEIAEEMALNELLEHMLEKKEEE